MIKSNVKVNAIYNIIKTCSTVLFPLITFPYVSRVLQPVNVGKIDFSNSIVSYFALIASLGISTYAVRECSSVKNNNEKLNNIASQIYSIGIVSMLFAYILLFITLIVFNNLKPYRLLIVIQSSVILLTAVGTDWINTAMEDFRYITVRTFVFQITSLILMLLFVKKPDDYIKYALICVLSGSGANISNILYRKKFCKIQFTFNLDIKKHLPPIMVLFVMMLSQTIFMNADKTMIGLINSDYEVGIYSTAVKVTNMLATFVTSIVWVIMPKMSLLYEQGEFKEINRILRKVLSFYIILGFPTVIGVIMLSSEIVQIIAGDSYLGASTVLKVLMVSLLFRFFGGGFVGNIIILPSKKEKFFMYACMISTVINIVLNVFFIKYFGAVGAAITTALSELLILIILLPKIDKKIQIKSIWKLITSPLIGCISIILICICSRILFINIWVRITFSICVSLLVYFIILYIFKNETVIELTSETRNKMKRKHD